MKYVHVMEAAGHDGDERDSGAGGLSSKPTVPLNEMTRRGTAPRPFSAWIVVCGMGMIRAPTS